MLETQRRDKNVIPLTVPPFVQYKRETVGQYKERLAKHVADTQSVVKKTEARVRAFEKKHQAAVKNIRTLEEQWHGSVTPIDIHQKLTIAHRQARKMEEEKKIHEQALANLKDHLTKVGRYLNTLHNV